MYMTTGEKLVELRKNKNLSQIQLSEQLGVSRQAISKWESGTAMPGIDSLIEISHFFGVTIDYLLKDQESEELPDEQPVVQEIPKVNETINKKYLLIIFTGITLLASILGFMAGLLFS